MCKQNLQCFTIVGCKPVFVSEVVLRAFAVETLVPGHCHLHSLKLNLPEAKAYFDWELPNEANCKLNVSAMGVC